MVSGRTMTSKVRASAGVVRQVLDVGADEGQIRMGALRAGDLGGAEIDADAVRWPQARGADGRCRSRAAERSCPAAPEIAESAIPPRSSKGAGAPSGRARRRAFRPVRAAAACGRWRAAARGAGGGRKAGLARVSPSRAAVSMFLVMPIPCQAAVRSAGGHR